MTFEPLSRRGHCNKAGYDLLATNNCGLTQMPYFPHRFKKKKKKSSEVSILAVICVVIEKSFYILCWLHCFIWIHVK